MNQRTSERPLYTPKTTVELHSEEQIGEYKMYEIVLCRGIRATIRDIYVRAIRYKDENDEEQIGKYLSFRMHEKEWQAVEIRYDEIEKLDGEINFEPGVKYARAKV